jgi:hypothetical protein
LFSYSQQLGLDWELDDAHELENYHGLVSQLGLGFERQII